MSCWFSGVYFITMTPVESAWKELSLPETVPGGMAAYRQTLAVLGSPGLFYSKSVYPKNQQGPSNGGV